MALIEWDDSYAVGHEQLDQQHRRLVAIANRLGEAIEAGTERQVLMKILSDLAGYTKGHFADEERAMEQAGYPGLDEHRAQHELLSRQLAEYYRSFYTASRPLASEVMAFLQQWLCVHILAQDKLYVPALAAARESAAAAAGESAASAP